MSFNIVERFLEMTHSQTPQTNEEKRAMVERMYVCGYLSKAQYEKYTYDEMSEFYSEPL